MRAHHFHKSFFIIFFSIVTIGLAYSQEEEELRKRKQELEEQKRLLEQERQERLAKKNEERQDRAYRIDVGSLTDRVSATEIMLFSGAEISFPQSPLLDTYKGKVFIDLLRFGYYPDIHTPVGVRLQLTTGNLSRDVLNKQANNPPTSDQFRFTNRLNMTQVLVGAKFLQSYSQHLLQPFASVDVMLGLMNNSKFAQLLDENGKPYEEDLAFEERVGKTSTFWGFRGRAGVEISITKLFNRHDEHYRGEGFFFSTSIGYARSFSENVNFLSTPKDYNPSTLDSDIYDVMEMSKINHIVQARKNTTFLEAYSIHIGIVYRGFNFNF